MCEMCPNAISDLCMLCPWPFSRPGFQWTTTATPDAISARGPRSRSPVAFLATHRPPLASTWVNAPRSYGQTLRSAICVLHHVTVVTVAFCLPACTGAVLPGVQAVRGGLGSRVPTCESLCTRRTCFLPKSSLAVACAFLCSGNSAFLVLVCFIVINCEPCAREVT